MNKQTVFLEGKLVGVTGANGFLGSHICNLLNKKAAIIHAYVYPGTSTEVINEDIKKSGGDIQFIDITKPDTLSDKFDKIDYLFQIAGSVAEWSHPHSKVFNINFRGARNVHLYARKAGVKRTVHTSTMVTNGSCPDPYPAVTSEDAPWDMGDTGVYSLSKYLGDRIAKIYNKPGVYETIRIRPHQILGWGDTGPSAPGQQILMVMEKGLPAYIDQVYNIASEKPVPVFPYLQYICKVAKVKPPKPIAIPKGLLKIAGFLLENLATHITHKTPLITRGNARTLCKNLGTSIERAKEELGFRPRPWQEAVKEAVRWFQEGYKPIKRTYDR